MSSHCIHWLITMAIFTTVDSLFPVTQPEEISNMTSCLIDIIKNLEDDLFKIAFFAPANYLGLVGLVMTLVKVPVLLNVAEKPLKTGLDLRTKSDLIVVMGDVDVSVLLTKVLWHKNTRFVLMQQNESEMEGVFQAFWNHKIIHVYALVNDSEDVVLYGFDPYLPNECGFAKAMEVDRWREGGFGHDGLSKIKETIRIRNMNGCPVNVTVVDVKPNIIFQDECQCNSSQHISGIEGNIMIEISKKLNMRVTYVIALDGVGWGWIKPNPSGTVGEVYTGRSDFGTGLLAPTIERYENLDLSVQINGDECITWGVPRGAGAKQPTWIMILIFEFSSTMWILIGLSFLVATIFFWFMQKSLKLVLYQNKFDLVLYLLGSCLGLPVKITESFTLRLAIFTWILFTFVTTDAYRSSMGSKLTLPTPDPDINTFKELLTSGLKLKGYNNMLRLMQYNGSEDDIKRMADEFVVTNFDIEYAVDAIARDRTFAYVRHSTTFRYYALINPKAKGHIHLIKECIYRYYPIIAMKKNSPFENRVNQIIFRLTECGITKYWISNYLYPLPRIPNSFVKLSLKHTFGMFFIIVIGFGVSLTFFFGELLYHRIYIKHNLLGKPVLKFQL